MTAIPGHRRTEHVKDWEPAFTALVTELYRTGNADMAAAAERLGHIAHWPRIPRLGELVRPIVDHLRGVRT